ncbi:MAG: DUF1540 domain-containing protein [Bacillota bacterium]
MQASYETVIRCTVDNCKFWTEGNRCAASRILVTSDLLAGSPAGLPGGGGLENVPVTPVTSFSYTCCGTFSPKEP